MKLNIIVCFLFLTTLQGFAQIDNRKTSIAIPAIESDKDSNSVSPLKTTDNNTPLNNSIVLPKLNFPKKEFSMFPQEEFGNPGEQYTKQLDKIEKGLLPEGHGEVGLHEDAYWGDYTTKSDYIEILYRDYGAIDGDYLEISVDDKIVSPRVFLGGNFSGFRLNLKQGLNRIEFKALNEGTSLPNTAAYKILDENGDVITGKIWALSTGVKVTVIINKE